MNLYALFIQYVPSGCAHLSLTTVSHRSPSSLPNMPFRSPARRVVRGEKLLYGNFDHAPFGEGPSLWVTRKALNPTKV